MFRKVTYLLPTMAGYHAVSAMLSFNILNAKRHCFDLKYSYIEVSTVSEDPDQTVHKRAVCLGLHCLLFCVSFVTLGIVGMEIFACILIRGYSGSNFFPVRIAPVFERFQI